MSLQPCWGRDAIGGCMAERANRATDILSDPIQLGWTRTLPWDGVGDDAGGENYLQEEKVRCWEAWPALATIPKP